MGVMGMLPMIGQMVGQPSALVGFAVHMVNSVIIGLGFSLVLGRVAKDLANGLTTGLAYGTMIEVHGGLQAGDRVVVRGNERLRSGQAVRIQQLPGEVAASG